MDGISINESAVRKGTESQDTESMDRSGGLKRFVLSFWSYEVDNRKRQ